ncbi:hypothetical protein E0Z10_g4193 [Xylaria hypoxylon]|uniref:DSBA-like thioredoxin domain-containing protein n=1 Tax=Xylaria hypoxylon TaxID=37992 RepID=A0A4Z0Z7T3_9PEZI|nr:hypothetical protein E0Z10_g4193 [Xylaria hypoxylon]
MTNFNIKVVSDTVCPWCYVGKSRLDRAIELYRKTYPAVATTLSQTEMMRQRLTTIGQEEGINFAFSGRIGNTRDSHRLIQLGKTKGSDVENRVVTELFKSYFEGDGDITSHATLIAAGEKAGLAPNEVKEWLETGKGGAEVDKEVQEAYANGVTGVPNITIQGIHNIGGAQEAEVFMATFAKIKGASK